MLRRLGVGVLVVLLCGSLSACMLADKEFTISVVANSNLPWSGSYMVVTAAGGSTSHSVDHVGSWQTTVKGTIVSLCFQKAWADGTLRVQILEGGRVVAESETTAEYGVVSAATGG